MTVGVVQLVVELWRKWTVKVDICALYVALPELIGPAEIFPRLEVLYKRSSLVNSVFPGTKRR